MALTRLHSLPLNQLTEEWKRLDQDGADTEMCRALARADRFYLLVRLCNRLDLLHPWIYARCREVEAAPDGHADIWAREHRKSTLITYGGALQEVLKDPNITIGLFSHNRHTAKAFLMQIQRELEFNERLKALFPDILYDNPTRDAPTWSLDTGLILKRQINPKEATIEAHGLVDGMPTGKHFQLRIYDDIVTRESVNTPEQIAKTTEAFELSDNLGTETGRLWIIGTRYSFADTYQTILERNIAIPRVYPATDNGMLDGTPVLFSQEEWERRVNAQGEYIASCQLLCNPLSGQQRMFDIEDLETYDIRPLTLNVYLLIDPARSRKKDSANTAMVVIGIDSAGNKYLLDGYNHKMDLMERWTRMRDLYQQWRREAGVVSVRVGYERYGAIADLDYFTEKMRNERLSFEIVELEWPSDGTRSKEDRVQRLVPDIKGHRFYVPYPTEATRLTKAQRAMMEAGYEYRISEKILRKDHNGRLYDLTEDFKLQLGFFPFGGLKDLPDAASRLYDMDPTAPVHIEDMDLEPEFV